MQFTGAEVTAGNLKKGDVLITLELPASGGIHVELVSKFAGKYGAGMRAAAEKILEQYHIKHASLLIEDSGALDFVISARVETALLRAMKRSAK